MFVIMNLQVSIAFIQFVLYFRRLSCLKYGDLGDPGSQSCDLLSVGSVHISKRWVLLLLAALCSASLAKGSGCLTYIRSPALVAPAKKIVYETLFQPLSVL